MTWVACLKHNNVQLRCKDILKLDITILQPPAEVPCSSILSHSLLECVHMYHSLELWSSCHCVHTSAGCAVFLNKYLWVIHMLKWHTGILTSNFIFAKPFSCLSTSFLYMTDRISNLVRKLTCYGNNDTQLCFLLASMLMVYGAAPCKT